MKKMTKKTLMIIQYSLDGGGAEKVLIDILKKFDYEQYSVTLLLIYRRGVYLSQVPKQVKIVSVLEKIPNAIRKTVFVRLWKIFKVGYFLLSQYKKYDTIISFLEGDSVRFHRWIMSWGRRNISWVHTDLIENHWTTKLWKDKTMERKIYSKMDSIVFVSRQSLLSFQKLYGNICNYHIIYNLINREEIIQQGNQQCDISRNKSLVICGVGRLNRIKRFDRFIKVIYLLNYKHGIEVVGWLIGEGEERKNLLREAERLGVNNKIIFYGFQENPYPYIKNSDLLLLTSDAEGFSLVVCEALCLGKPVVSTRITGPTEILENNVGLLTDLDEESIATEIAHMIFDKKISFYAMQSADKSKDFNVNNTMSKIYGVINGTR